MAMELSFSTDFDGSTTDSAIRFSSESLIETEAVVVDEIFIKMVDALAAGFVMAAK